MRLREILTVFIYQAKLDHWDESHAVWRHHRGDCPMCAAAIDAQTALSINFVDVTRGDRVQVAPNVFGVVDDVRTVAHVRLGFGTARGVMANPDAVVVQVDAHKLTSLEQSG